MAYSSWKATCCAKHTISSSASLISLGNSSIFAFLLSLLHLLCSTLLTLVGTRTKRVQLEYYFGSSFHTPGVFCFSAVSFRRLHVIRVAQAFVSSFLFEVLISGILPGLSGTYIFDHSTLDSSVNICISPIRLATNGQKSFPRPQIHLSTSLPSVSSYTQFI